MKTKRNPGLKHCIKNNGSIDAGNICDKATDAKKELDLENIAENITHEEFAGAVKETMQFSSFLDQPVLPHIKEVPSMSPLAVLVLLATINEQVIEKARVIYGEIQSKNASNPRLSRRKLERKTVFTYWEGWQKNLALYSTESAFISDMQEKTGIDRRETIRGWIKEFEASPSQLDEIG